MEKKSIKNQEVFATEEENILVWANVQSLFEKTFGTEVYSSWLKTKSKTIESLPPLTAIRTLSCLVNKDLLNINSSTIFCM